MPKTKTKTKTMRKVQVRRVTITQQGKRNEECVLRRVASGVVRMSLFGQENQALVTYMTMSNGQVDVSVVFTTVNSTSTAKTYWYNPKKGSQDCGGPEMGFRERVTTIPLNNEDDLWDATMETLVNQWITWGADANSLKAVARSLGNLLRRGEGVAAKTPTKSAVREKVVVPETPTDFKWLRQQAAETSLILYVQYQGERDPKSIVFKGALDKTWPAGVVFQHRKNRKSKGKYYTVLDNGEVRRPDGVIVGYVDQSVFGINEAMNRTHVHIVSKRPETTAQEFQAESENDGKDED